MFSFFNGVPRLIIPDNLKSGVNRASFYYPEINRSYGVMAAHYGVGVLPARPRRPKDKAKFHTAPHQVFCVVISTRRAGRAPRPPALEKLGAGGVAFRTTRFAAGLAAGIASSVLATSLF